MASIITASIDVSKLPKEKFVKAENGKVWYNFTIKVNDESRYSNNGMVVDSQTKEQNDAYKSLNSAEKKEYIKKIKLGNARVVWTDGTINKFVKEEDQEQTVVNNTNQGNDLPF
mgnify:FL=1|tara:strand:+ start:179 stop:520 length:342 start_codon:yes stop_codon:yes gene_type:complete